VVRVSIGFVGQGDRRRPASPDQLDDRPHLLRSLTQLSVRQPEVHAPRGAEDHARVLGFRQALLDGAVAAHLSGREVAQSDLVAVGDVFRNGAAEPDLEIVGMGAEDEQIDGIEGHRSQRCPCVPTALSTWPMNSLNAL